MVAGIGVADRECSLGGSRAGKRKAGRVKIGKVRAGKRFAARFLAGIAGRRMTGTTLAVAVVASDSEQTQARYGRMVPAGTASLFSYN
jgi:hypothetical protein